MINLAFAVVQVLLVGSAAGQELKKVKIGCPASSYKQIDIWIAKNGAIYRRHGLDAEIFFRDGQIVSQALVAGDPPIVNIGTVAQAASRGMLSC